MEKKSNTNKNKSKLEVAIDVIKLVKDMRAAQKLYFSNRSFENLKTAKQLENKVDKSIMAFEIGTFYQKLFD